MRPIITAIVASSLATACNESPPAPSCVQAMNAYYGASCYLSDVSVSPPEEVPYGEALYLCQQLYAAAPEQCYDAMNDVLRCFESAPADCDCSVEWSELFRCE